jgi:hypothetical protein
MCRYSSQPSSRQRYTEAARPHRCTTLTCSNAVAMDRWSVVKPLVARTRHGLSGSAADCPLVRFGLVPAMQLSSPPAVQ